MTIRIPLILFSLAATNFFSQPVYANALFACKSTSIAAPKYCRMPIGRTTRYTILSSSNNSELKKQIYKAALDEFKADIRTRSRQYKNNLRFLDTLDQTTSYIDIFVGNSTSKRINRIGIPIQIITDSMRRGNNAYRRALRSHFDSVFKNHFLKLRYAERQRYEAIRDEPDDDKRFKKLIEIGKGITEFTNIPKPTPNQKAQLNLELGLAAQRFSLELAKYNKDFKDEASAKFKDVQAAAEEAEQRQQVNKADIRKLFKNYVKLQDFTLDLSDQVGDLRSDLKNYSKKLGFYFRTTEKRFKQVQNQLGVLDTDLVFTQRLLYNSLPAALKLKALEDERFARRVIPDAKRRAREIAQLKLIDTRQKIGNTIKEYAGYIADTGKIVSNLGLLKGKDAERLNRVVGYASAAADVGASIATGNYLGALVTVTSLFGRKKPRGPTPEQLILKRLGAIGERVEEAIKRIDRLIEGQVAIWDAVQELRETLLDSHRLIHGKLSEIDRKLERNYQTLLSLVTLSTKLSEINIRLEACRSFLQSRGYHGSFVSEDSSPYGADVSIGRFTDWQDLHDHLELSSENFDWFVNCKSALSTIFSHLDKSGAPFYPLLNYSSHTFRDNTGDLASFRTAIEERTYRPLLDVLKRHYVSVDDQRSTLGVAPTALFALASPNRTYKGIEWKVHNLENLKSANLSSGDAERFLGELLYPQQVIDYVIMLLEVLPYYDIVDKRHDLLESRDIVKRSVSLGPIIAKLNVALRMVNVSIAQQSLLSGDVVLPFLGEYLFTRSDPVLRERLVGALLQNSNLRKNVLTYEFMKNLSYEFSLSQSNSSYEDRFAENIVCYANIYKRIAKQNEVSLFSFAKDAQELVALAVKPKPIDPTICKGHQWKDIFGSKFEFAGNAVRVQYQGIKKNLQMPTPAELRERKFSHGRQLFYLMNLRDRILRYTMNFKRNRPHHPRLDYWVISH